MSQPTADSLSEPEENEEESSESSPREALSEIAGIASQRGTDRQMFSMEDYRRLGEIERLARRVLRGESGGTATDG